MTASLDGLSPEQRVAALGWAIPDYADPPYGGRYGAMKAYHRRGRLVTLSGMTPETRAGVQLHPGRVGEDVTTEQGYEAARYTAINVLGLIRLALGSLDNVASLVNTLCFTVSSADYTTVNKVGEGARDVFIEAFGRDAGRAPSTGIGVMSLARGNCFEIWTTVEAVSEEGIR